MPETWGRTLMKRRAVQKAKEKGGTTPKLYDLDFLLGVYDESRMGTLRFKLVNDTVDKALWEFLTYKLAVNSGIEMSPSKVQRVAGRHHTFFTKRFDRIKGERVHFSSAMTMTGKNEETIREKLPSYL